MNAAFSTNALGRAGASDSSDAEVDLPRLVGLLGPETVTLLGQAPHRFPVTSAEFYETLDGLPDAAGAVLIVPSGDRLDTAELSALAAQAAELGYAAIALKCRDAQVAEIRAIASSSTLPVIRVAETVSWRVFEAQLARLLGEQRRAEDAHLERGAEPLFAVANELAAYFGGSVAVEDLGRRIIAYSSVPGQRIDTVRAEGILARRVPDSPHNAEQYRSVIRADLPLKFPQMGEELPRAATTIRAGALPLGTIWAIDPTGDGPLSDEQLGRLRSAATVAAAHMLDDVRMRETGQLPRENRLRALLSGDAVTGAELSELGIPEQRGALLIAFDLGREEHATALAQLRSTVQRHLALHAPETVSITRRGRVYSLLADRAESRVAELLEPLLGMLEQLVGGIITVAVSGRAQRAIGVAHLREQVDRLFDVADGSTRGTGVGARLLTVAGLRPSLLLERVREQFDREPELRNPELAELMAEQPQVAIALRYWLENLGNVSRAAEAAGVHENTIRYRLRRAEQQYGVKLHDPDARLAMWLQLRAQLG